MTKSKRIKMIGYKSLNKPTCFIYIKYEDTKMHYKISNDILRER